MKRILVIEDDAMVRASICATLSKQGFDVLEAGDGCSAIRMLKKISVALVITDIFMHDKDGIEIIREIKTSWPQLKIVAISGGGLYLDPDLYLYMAKAFGADVVLNKPVKSEMMIDEINNLLTQHSGMD